ncbi:MAG: hypothetical protein M1831_006772 [Alyxoria varia]|nr:MAG: hypothetical protein M1831_006772 [Alyxoria varia]
MSNYDELVGADLSKFATVPITPPPAGEVSNFENPPSERIRLIAPGSVFMVLVVLFVLVRIHFKARVAKNFTTDDYTCVVGAFWMRVCSWVGIAITAFSSVAFLIAFFVIGSPRPGEAFRDVYLDSSRTDRLQVVTEAQAGMNIALDFMFLIMPLAAVMQIQLSRARKFGVVAVFLSGIAKARSEGDQSIHFLVIYLTSLVEAQVCTICSCAPSFAGAARTHVKKWPWLYGRLSHASKKIDAYASNSKRSAVVRAHGQNVGSEHAQTSLRPTYSTRHDTRPIELAQPLQLPKTVRGGSLDHLIVDPETNPQKVPSMSGNTAAVEDVELGESNSRRKFAPLV